jgi:outer membrane murein-binding lipoprotein Lpp
MATTAAKPPKAGLTTAQIKMARYAEISQELDELKTQRQPLEEEQAKLRADLQAWADDPQNAKLFANGMTVRVDAGQFGYRSTPEKLGWNLDVAAADVAGRTAAVVEAVRKILPSAVKVSYDEKPILKAWDIMPKLRGKLEEIGIIGPVRERQFIINLNKTAA